MDTTVSTRPLRRNEASEYLLSKYGINRTSSTLAKLAVTGGGPAFRKAGRFPLYTIDALDKWAASIMSPEVSSTSELEVVQ